MRKFGKESAAPEDTGGSREKSDSGWLKNHWCALSLCVIVIAAILLRTVFAYGVSADGNFALSGGSSAQYHLHVIESILNGNYALTDSAVNYPNGGLMVYPPLVDFLAAIPAMIFSALGFSTTEAASAGIGVLNPIIGALTCIPVYLVGKELYGKKAGVVAALVFAFLALPISTSVFSSGTEYALAAFLVAFMSLFLIKMVKALDAEEGAGKSVYVNAAVAGIFLGLAALTWNGFRILMVLLIVAMIAQILVDRFKGRNMMTSLVAYSVAMLIGVAIAAAYYIPAGLWDTILSGTVIIAVLAIVFGFIFKAVESKPWIVTIPALVVVFIVVLAVMYFAVPDLFTAVVYGNSIYSSSIMASLVSGHVSMSNVAAYYGWLTMWLPLCLAIYETYVFLKKDRSCMKLFTVVWLYALFFSVWTSYANAAVIGVVFAVGSGAVIVKVLEKANLKVWYKSMKTAGFPGCFRKMIKPLPFASVLIVALLVIVPNFTFAIDAGTPSNSGDHFYSGNTSFTIKTGDSYPIGDLWDEYADQEKSGALVNWIDYTYDAVSQGKFDTVTDLIGGGSSAVAQLYMSDGSAGSIAAMIMRLVMSGDIDKFSGVLPSQVVDYIDDPASAVAEIESNPSVYGKLRADITDENAVYLASIEYLTTYRSVADLDSMYNQVCSISGNKISYVLGDGSLLPLQYGDGSSFSTVAYFAGYSVDNYGAASQFYSINTYYGITQYTDAIYDTFLWKMLIGPSASDAGYTSSYSYLSALALSNGKAGSAMAVPGYGLYGYDVAYWNVQYNPDNNATVGGEGWTYMNGYEAIAKQKAEGGMINYLSSIVMLEYTGSSSGTSSVQVNDEDGNLVNNVTVSTYVYNETYGKYVLVSENKTVNGLASIPAVSSDRVRYEISVGGQVIQTYSAIPEFIELGYGDVSGYVKVGDDVLDSELRLELEGQTVGPVDPEKISVENGVIDVNDLLPDVYDYTLYDSTGSSIATGSFTVVPGSNDGLIITPKTYTLTVTVNDINDKSVDSGIVIATNVNTGAQFQGSVEDGKAVITVLPGTYSYSMGEGMATVHSSTSNASSGNRSTIIEAYPAQTVTIINAVDTVYKVSAGTFSTTSYIGTDGGVKFDLPVSVATDNMLYTVYGTSNGNVYYGVCQDGMSSISLTTAPAVKVTGVLKNGDNGVSGTVRFIDSNNAVFTVGASSDGKFSMYIPAGTYTVYADNGSDKVFIGSKTVSSASADVGDVSLVDGRKITYTFRYDPEISGTSRVNVPFILSVMKYTYEGADYTFYGMTGINGSSEFYIPDNIECKISFNNAEGTLDNAAFDCTDLVKSISSGTSNNNQTAPIKVREKDDDKNVLKDMSVTAQYAMTLTKYDDDEKVYTFTAGQTQMVSPGQYNVVIDGTQGYYYKGTGYVYAGTTGIIGMDVEKVFPVIITKANEDILKIESEGAYHISGTTYYFEEGYDYFLKSERTADGKQYLRYGYIESGSTPTTMDMTTSAESMTITGYIGTAADGTVSVTYGNVTVEFEVDGGSYSVVLPSDVTSATFHLEVSQTIDGETYQYVADRSVSGLKDGDVRNIAVITGSFETDEEEDESDYKAAVSNISAANGVLSFTLTLNNNTDDAVSFLVEAGSAWFLGTDVRYTVDAGCTATVTINGYYDAGLYALGSDGMDVTVSDINDAWTETIDLAQGSENTSGRLGQDILFATEGGVAFKDKVSAYEYMYAFTIVNKDSYSKQVTLNVNSVPGWYVTLTNEDGSLVYDNGSSFTVYGYQTTVVYAKLMPLDGNDESISIPNISGTVSVGGDSKSFNLEPETISLTTDSMSASGTDVFNERSGIPAGIWFMVAVMVLLIIAIFWLASKRGVFSRRK